MEVSAVRAGAVAILASTALALGACGSDGSSELTTGAAVDEAAEEQAAAGEGQAAGSFEEMRASGRGDARSREGAKRERGGDRKGAGRSGSETVRIIDFEFRPRNLVVAAGSKVKFVNEDSAVHTATASGDQPAFDTGNVKGGGSARVELDRAGTYAYICDLHPYMKAKLTVE